LTAILLLIVIYGCTSSSDSEGVGNSSNTSNDTANNKEEKPTLTFDKTPWTSTVPPTAIAYLTFALLSRVDESFATFTASTDSVIEALKEHHVIDTDLKGPQNNRSFLQAYFNILWELGFEPENFVFT